MCTTAMLGVLGSLITSKWPCKQELRLKPVKNHFLSWEVVHEFRPSLPHIGIPFDGVELVNLAVGDIQKLKTSFRQTRHRQLGRCFLVGGSNENWHMSTDEIGWHFSVAAATDVKRYAEELQSRLEAVVGQQGSLRAGLR